MLPNGSTFPIHQENPAPSLGCLEAVQQILSSFPGTFVELCKNCFHDSPQKISSREQGTVCNGHSWRPILVFCQNGEQKRVIYDEIRPLPKHNIWQWNYCKYVIKGEPCWHGAHRCWFAHSGIEKTVWESESKGILDRSHLLHASQRRQSQSSGASSRTVSQERERQHYCQVCKSQFPSNEEFLNHCFTVKHRKLIYEDTSSTWQYRDPPWTTKVFKLCERRATCEYGDNCMDAHSIEELKEWQDRRKAARKKTRAAGKQGLLSYQDSLLEEYRRSKNKDMIVALDVVALMRQDVGATFVLGEDSREERSYSNGVWFETQDTSNNQKVYEVIVSFTSDHKGFYEQWLVFDFDMRPVLLQKLKVIVGEQLSQRVQDTESTQQTIDSFSNTLETQHAQYAEQIWQEETVEIVPYWQRTEAQQELLNRYRHPERHLSTETTGPGPITHQNYKKKMHSFLYQEEMEQDNLVRR
ncbi:hypothetical protein AOLI_G00011510 [Acnodon oligacanthus]